MAETPVPSTTTTIVDDIRLGQPEGNQDASTPNGSSLVASKMKFN